MGFEAPSQLHGGDRVQSFNFKTARTPCEEPIGAPLERARVRLAALLSDLDGRLGEHATPLLQEARRQTRGAGLPHRRDRPDQGRQDHLHQYPDRPAGACCRPTSIPGRPWSRPCTSGTAARPRACRRLPAVLRRRMEADRQGRWTPARADRTACAGLPAGPAARAAGGDAQPLRAPPRRRSSSSCSARRIASRRSRPSCWPTTSAPATQLEGSSEGDRRNYSDITRSADLYFNESPFAFPITLIDTPGTNDPFLVRDEITRRSLENPDIYIFVVSACSRCRRPISP